MAAVILGTLALLTGCLAVGIIPGVIAWILGNKAVAEIDRSNGEIGGRDWARAGVFLGRTSVVIALAAMIMIPYVMITERRSGGKMYNSTQLTGICRTMVFWSDEFYAQTLDFPKVGLPPVPGLKDYTIASNSPTDRIATLCNTGSDVLSPRMLVNHEAGTDKPAKGDPPGIRLQSNNLSYAVLDALNVEWKNRVNSSAPIAADKQVGKGSYWDAANWEGNVVWGDSHVSWESGETSRSWPTTTIGGYTTVNDNLFTGDTGPEAKDAVLINP